MDRKDYMNKRRIKLKREVFSILGGCLCRMCGNTDLRVLTINHKNGKTSKEGGLALQHAIKNGSRKIDDLEILCMNCNIIYEYERGKRNGDNI